MVAVVAVTGVLHHPVFTPNQPGDTHIASSSATISESPSPSASATPKFVPQVKAKVETTTPVFLPTPTPVVIPTAAPTSMVQIYNILSLPELVNMNGANALSVGAAQSAYNTFLQTPNLQYMTPVQQHNLFGPMLDSAVKSAILNSLNQQKDQLDKEIQQKLNQSNSLPIPSSNNSYQTCLNNKVASINDNPFLSESSRLGQIERAKYDCAN